MKNKITAKIGILAACSCSLSYMAFSPVIANISAAFPDTNISLVQMVITLPSLLFIVFSPLAGKLAQFIRKKALALISILLYIMGGLLPFFFHNNIWQILAGSIIIGCGGGMLMPIINSITCDCFDDRERGQLMGLNATFVALGAMLFSFVSGQLSSLGWHYSFLCFLLLIPIFLVVLKCLPDGITFCRGSGTKGGFQFSPYIGFLFVIGIVYFIMQNSFNTNSSIYIREMGIGDASTASAATMCNTLGGILGGVCFSFLASKTKRQIETVALGISGAGFFLSFFLPSLIPILFGGAMIGFSFAIFNAAGTYLLSKILKPENNVFTASVYMAAINLGAALSPMVVNPLSGILSNKTSMRFLITGIVIAICAVVSMLLNIRKKTEL